MHWGHVSYHFARFRYARATDSNAAIALISIKVSAGKFTATVNAHSAIAIYTGAKL